jgi:tetratricopeptide (TPR) repeat protein
MIWSWLLTAAVVGASQAPFLSCASVADTIDRKKQVFRGERLAVEYETFNLAKSALYTDLLQSRPLRFPAKCVLTQKTVDDAFDFFQRTGDYRKASRLKHKGVSVAVRDGRYADAISRTIHAADEAFASHHAAQGLIMLNRAAEVPAPAGENYERTQLLAELWYRDPTEAKWKDFVVALANTEPLSALKPDVYSFAVLYRADGQPQKAAALLKRALQPPVVAPARLEAMLGELALDEVLTRKHVAANATIERIFDMGQSFNAERKIFQIALAESQCGRDTDAIALLQRRLSSCGNLLYDRDDEVALLSHLYVRRRNLSQAEAVLRQASAGGRTSNTIQRQLAVVLTGRRKYEEAFAVLIAAAQDYRNLDHDGWFEIEQAMSLIADVPSLRNIQTVSAIVEVVKDSFHRGPSADLLRRILKLTDEYAIQPGTVRNLQERLARELPNSEGAALLEKIATSDPALRAEHYLEAANYRELSGEFAEACRDIQLSEKSGNELWLAELRAKQGHFAEARKIIDALCERGDFFGTPDSGYIRRAIAIANIYRTAGQRQEAKALLEQLSTTVHRACGPVDRSLLDLLDELVAIYESDGDVAKASAYRAERARIWAANFGRRKPLPGIISAAQSGEQTQPESLKKYDPGCTLGALYIPVPTYASSDEPALLQWLHSDESENGWASEEAVESTHRIARFYLRQKRYTECEKYLKHLLELTELRDGRRSQERANIMLDLAWLFAVQHDTNATLKWIAAAQIADEETGRSPVGAFECVRYAALLASVGHDADASDYVAKAKPASDAAFPWRAHRFNERSDDLLELLNGVPSGGATVRELIADQQKGQMAERLQWILPAEPRVVYRPRRAN